jgi:hypothetical protein
MTAVDRMPRASARRGSVNARLDRRSRDSVATPHPHAAGEAGIVRAGFRFFAWCFLLAERREASRLRKNHFHLLIAPSPTGTIASHAGALASGNQRADNTFRA